MTVRTDAAVAAGDGVALAGVSLGFFLVLFDATAVNVATGGIGNSLNASVSAVQWVLNAYTVTFAALMLSAGSLGDRWGSRRAFLTGATVFALASAVCAAAPNAPVLIAARVVQGVGAAAVVPCSLALIAARYPEGARSRALGVWGGVSGVGLASGPVAGGVLVSALGWRVVFVVVVPLAAVSVALVSARFDETPRRSVARFDFLGQMLIVVALVALTASLTAGALRLLAVAVLAGGAFVVVEHRFAEPMLPPALFRNARLSGAVGVGLLFNFGLYGSLFCLALVLERTMHRSSAAAGLALLPLTAATALGALLSGRLVDRFGPRVSMFLGLGGGLVGALLLAVFGESALWIAVLGAVLGLVGFAMPAMTAVALAAAGAGRAGLGAALLNATRQAGGAFGVALLGRLALHGPRIPMLLAALGYVIALVVTATAIPSRP